MNTFYTYEEFSNIKSGSYEDPLHYFLLWSLEENIDFCRAHGLPSPPDFPVERSYSGADTGLYAAWTAFPPDQRDAFVSWANIVVSARWACYQNATRQVVEIGAAASTLAKGAVHVMSNHDAEIRYTFEDYASVKFASCDDPLHYFSLWTIEGQAGYCKQNRLPKPPVMPVRIWMPEDPNMTPGFRPDWWKFTEKEKAEYTVWANRVADRRWFEYRGGLERMTVRIAPDDESFGELIDFAELQSEVDKLNSLLADQEEYEFTQYDDIHEIRVGDEIPFGSDRVVSRTLH